MNDARKRRGRNFIRSPRRKRYPWRRMRRYGRRAMANAVRHWTALRRTAVINMNQSTWGPGERNSPGSVSFLGGNVIMLSHTTLHCVARQDTAKLAQALLCAGVGTSAFNQVLDHMRAYEAERFAAVARYLRDKNVEV